MRICHVIEAAAGGSGGIVLSLAELGAAAGEQVSVIYSPIRASPQFLSGAMALADVRFIPLDMSRAICAQDLRAGAALRSIFQRERFDVVHSHSSKAGALARLAGIGGNSVQIYSPHGFVTMATKATPMYRTMERFLGQFCDSIVAVSKKERAHGLSLGIADSKIVVVPNGISERLVVQTPITMPVRDHFTVGFVGRFAAQKDPTLALAAFRRLVDVYPNSRLIMIGDGELGDTVIASVAALGIGANIELLGDRTALPFYPQFDVLLCSSQFEGMPVAFLEALAHGVPIVSTDVGGVDELVQVGETGFVAERTAASLGAQLIAVASLDPVDRLKFSERAVTSARMFSSQAMSMRTLGLYRTCALKRGSLSVLQPRGEAIKLDLKVTKLSKIRAKMPLAARQSGRLGILSPIGTDAAEANALLASRSSELSEMTPDLSARSS